MAYSKEDIKNIIEKYITTKRPKINCRKNKTTFNTNMDAYNKTMHEVLSLNEPLLYAFLTNTLGVGFESRELFNYIYDVNGLCDKCGNKLKFKTLHFGYDKCDCDKKQLTTKLDVYNYLCEHAFEYLCTSNGFIEKIKSDVVIGKMIDFTNISTLEDLYLYLTDSEPKKCVICGKPTKFKSFKKSKRSGESYLKCCSKSCFYKLRSIQQKKDNTYHRISEEKRNSLRKEASNRMKQKIKNGTFTPSVTNSWSHSLICLKFKRDGKIIEQKCRSSWEAMFQLMNPNLKYEKLRIPYFDCNNEPRTYIVDFIDTVNRVVYEVKPNSLKHIRNNVKKQEALQEWANQNGYSIEIITETYFVNNVFKVSLLNYCDDFYKNKIMNILQHYKNFNIDYEN